MKIMKISTIIKVKAESEKMLKYLTSANPNRKYNRVKIFGPC